MLHGTGLRAPSSVRGPLPLWNDETGVTAIPLHEGEETAAATTTDRSSSSGGRCGLCCAALGWGAVPGLMLLIMSVCFIVQYAASAAGGDSKETETLRDTGGDRNQPQKHTDRETETD